ncbi:MAG: NADH-quinone oxidoreductase subunit I [Deltaproteobacteria bacterium]|nr:NADH-quinone oxidoreductase subunit I [Deltaproteobacteria bacterium]
MAITVKVVKRSDSTMNKETYLPQIFKGMGVTIRHFFRNVFGGRDTQTLKYPEEKIAYPERFRGLHRLNHRPGTDGRVRCVACMLCPTVCPAHCITVVAEDTGDPSIEKAPALFEIDELRCVVCGLCVEACPVDAIRMDTGVHMKPVSFRGDAILGKVDLMKLGTDSRAVQGGKGGDWRGA